MSVSQCKLNVPVEHYLATQLTLEQFEEKFLRPGHPVVLQGVLPNLPLSKWTMEYLSKTVGNNEVNVRGKTDQADYKTGKSYTIRQTTFQEYVDDLKRKTHRGTTSYMAVQNISKTFPQLQEECILPNIIGKIHNSPFLWVGHKGHYEYCHYDPDASMLMMIEGEKQARLFSCSDHENLYPNPLGSKGKTIQSQVDCDNPNMNKFPKFANATCHYCTLHAGDMLFIPAFWWHQITSLTDSVSANAFFGDSGVDKYISRILEPPVYTAFKHWLTNVIEQNRSFASFERTLERLHLCVENLILKQFHEVAQESHIKTLVAEILLFLGLEKLPEFKGGGKHPPPIKIRGLRWR
uniref:Lysine-specific demethylase 8 n=1 Tax=Phallusia mammillata TaxID=59560 RepID=A0A6F9DF44_9ASCI|nr:lysine-specific demethylase 8 [Phallusia mammillata]